VKALVLLPLLVLAALAEGSLRGLQARAKRRGSWRLSGFIGAPEKASRPSQETRVHDGSTVTAATSQLRLIRVAGREAGEVQWRQQVAHRVSASVSATL
jgi:hypothetical protein